jgi:hypothetical protein
LFKEAKPIASTDVIPYAATEPIRKSLPIIFKFLFSFFKVIFSI